MPGSKKEKIIFVFKGGSGWTLSWGCAQEVVELVQANIKKAKRHQYAGSGSGKSSNSNKPASKL